MVRENNEVIIICPGLCYLDTQVFWTSKLYTEIRRYLLRYLSFIFIYIYLYIHMYVSWMVIAHRKTIGKHVDVIGFRWIPVLALDIPVIGH